MSCIFLFLPLEGFEGAVQSTTLGLVGCLDALSDCENLSAFVRGTMPSPLFLQEFDGEELVRSKWLQAFSCPCT